METMKTAALAAALAVVMGSAAFSDPAARANTSDPNSAPLASPTGGPVRVRYTNDVPARANTADPGSAPLARNPRPARGPLDAAGRADTRDPG
jgi:hypothetical protein